MKTLLVLRHAKASQESPSGLDFDRPLSGRGRRQALALGQMIREQGMAVDAIVASPAARVVETLSGVREGGGTACEPVFDRRVYNASYETLVGVIREADDAVGLVLVVGHNPGLHHLVLHLAGGDSGAVVDGYPTATLAELRLSIDHWRDIDRCCGRIVRLVRPEV